MGRQWHIIGNHNIYVRLTTTQAKLLKQIIDSCHSATAAAATQQNSRQSSQQSTQQLAAAAKHSQTIAVVFRLLFFSYLTFTYVFMCAYTLHSLVYYDCVESCTNRKEGVAKNIDQQ